MSVLVEGPRSVFLGAQAFLVEEDRELAWAEPHIVKNSNYKYVLGKYVEADKANSNGQIFDLKDLPEAQKTIAYSPLNIWHVPQRVVGAFVASELVYPMAAHAGVEEPLNPTVEALAAFWKFAYPDEFAKVEKAHNTGSLYFSMEALPETIKCAAICGDTFPYDGRQSATYCAHLNQPGAMRLLNKPHFQGGALIFPPVKPGWRHADITQLSALLTSHADEAEVAYQEVKKEMPHLESSQWEQMVAQVVQMAYEDTEGPESARKFTAAQRTAAAKSGHALKDGSFPIESPEDLGNAISAIGRAAPGKRAMVKAHIIRRAKALGKTSMLPDDWNS